ESIIRAHAALRPAAVGAATHPLPEEVFNRRWYLKPGQMPLNPFGRLDKVKMNPGTSPDVLDHPAGPTDPDITIISVQDAKRKPLALFANYSLHYVGGVPRCPTALPGISTWRRSHRRHSSARASHARTRRNNQQKSALNIPFGIIRPPREPFEQIRIVAQNAADTAWYAHRKIEKHRADVRLGMIQRQVTLKYRRPTADQIAEAKAVLAVKDPAAIEKLPRLAQHYAHSTLAAAERPEETL